MPVLGLGGFFWRAQDPEGLASWYREHLGVGNGCGTDENGETNEWLYYPEPGPMVFQPFKATTDYFEADKAFMFNFRVSDLDSLCEQLNAKGIEVITKAEWDMPEVGKFARIHDPEGNAIELWEPAAKPA
ncbi:VOC family protein [Sphingomonas sp. LB-2]|uniref:VOC family protein n=1 Tax=Sphingomonas caeni TaxID=2984949 RepID=UPI002230BA56|nr:VOC family protein [Sphingomonas caeni]MCW3846055.1 VOC family protein [Sphingomonas caeni]